MKKNLHFLQLLITVKKLNLVKNLLYLTFFFISLPVFSQNPLLLNNPFPVGSGRSIQKIVSTSTGKTFFNTVDNNNHFSPLWGLWTTDGTQAGTNKLTLTSPPVPGGTNNFISSEATLLSKLGNDKIIFAGDNEGGYGEVWVSNGTQAGTFVLEQFFGSSSTGTTVSNITTFGNNVVYSVITNDNKLQLHKTDGTYAGTGIVYDFGLYTDYSVGYFKTIGNFVYFELNNNTTTHNEIWRTDGTAAGTVQIKDLGQGYGFASDFMSFANNIYFITISSTFGDYIWKSDGTNVGTAPLKQISTTFNSDNLFPSYAAVENSLILSKNLLYFAANDGSRGKELWKTDGTVAGTGMTFDFYTGATGSNPNWLTVLNNQLYFTANSSFFPQGTALYYYNGSQFSQPISTASNPSNLTVQNNTILFSAAQNTSDGNELWITDGGTANTFEIANINPVANASSNPSLMSVTGNNTYFAATFDVNGDGIDDPAIFKYTAPQKIWTGNINSDGSNIDNWFPQGVPANGDNILFPANPLNNYTNPFLFCNDFINNGSTINVNNGLCLISGTFYNTGTINNTSGGGVFGVVSNNTNAIRNIGSPGFYNGQLTLSGGLNTRLTSNIKVNTLRVEGGDTIYLGPYSFQIDAFNLFIPKIITDSSGRFIMPVGSSPVTFPVMADTKSYTPVTISNGGVVDYFAVNVKNNVLKNGTAGDTVKQQVVNKTWNIFEALGGGSNATITAQWNAADELAGFNRNNVYLNHYTAGAWDSGTPGVASGLGPYTFTRNGFTSFSPFSISSSTSVLPIHLISFTATAQKDKVQLQWSTATETNSRDFKIQRSLDGINFETIGTVVAAGNSSTIRNYSFDDLQSISLKGKLVFFRIVETDIDGHLFYTDVKKVKIGDGKNNFTLVHNPVQNEALLNYESVEKYGALIRVVDHLGRVIISKQVQIIEGVNQIKLQTGNLAKGIYEVELTSNKNHGVVRMMKE